MRKLMRYWTTAVTAAILSGTRVFCNWGSSWADSRNDGDSQPHAIATVPCSGWESRLREGNHTHVGHPPVPPAAGRLDSPPGAASTLA